MSADREHPEWLSAYVLGILPPDEQSACDAIVRADPELSRLVAEQRAAAALLAGAVRKSPPPALKRRVMAAVRTQPRVVPGVPAWFGWTAALAAGFLFVVGWRVMPGEDAAPFAVVAALSGSAEADDRPLVPGQPIKVGSSIKTAPGTVLEIRFGDNAIAKLKDESEATLNAQDGRIQVALSRGWIMSMVKKGSDYAVLTPLAEARALGTVFFVRAGQDGRAYMCICQGRIAVNGRGGFTRTMEAPAHAAMGLLGEGEGVRETPETLRYHADEDGASLAEHFTASAH